MEEDQVVFECMVAGRLSNNDKAYKRVLVSFRYAINTVDRE